MAIQYSGQTPQDTFFVGDGTRLQLVNKLEAALAAVGWTAVSGAGSADWVYQSATTPGGQFIQVHATDPGGTANCAVFKLRSTTGLEAAAGYLQNTNVGSYRIIANKYQFFMWLTGTTAQLRHILYMGVPYVFPFLTYLLDGNEDFGFMHAQAFTDTDVRVWTSTFRQNLGAQSVQGYSMIRRGAAFTNNANLSHFGISLQGSNQSGTATSGTYTYEDGSWNMFEPILILPTGNVDSITTTRFAQIWDAVVSTKNYDSEALRTIGTQKWRNITHQNVATTDYLRGTLLLLSSG